MTRLEYQKKVQDAEQKAQTRTKLKETELEVFAGLDDVSARTDNTTRSVNRKLNGVMQLSDRSTPSENHSNRSQNKSSYQTLPSQSVQNLNSENPLANYTGNADSLRQIAPLQSSTKTFRSALSAPKSILYAESDESSDEEAEKSMKPFPSPGTDGATVMEGIQIKDMDSVLNAVLDDGVGHDSASAALIGSFLHLQQQQIQQPQNWIQNQQHPGASVSPPLQQEMLFQRTLSPQWSVGSPMQHTHSTSAAHVADNGLIPTTTSPSPLVSPRAMVAIVSQPPVLTTPDGALTDLPTGTPETLDERAGEKKKIGEIVAGDGSGSDTFSQQAQSERDEDESESDDRNASDDDLLQAFADKGYGFSDALHCRYSVDWTGVGAGGEPKFRRIQGTLWATLPLETADMIARMAGKEAKFMKDLFPDISDKTTMRSEADWICRKKGLRILWRWALSHRHEKLFKDREILEKAFITWGFKWILSKGVDVEYYGKPHSPEWDHVAYSGLESDIPEDEETVSANEHEEGDEDEDEDGEEELDWDGDVEDEDTSPDYGTALYHAVKLALPEFVDVLLGAGATVTEQELYLAAKHCNINILLALVLAVEDSSDPSKPDDQTFTAVLETVLEIGPERIYIEPVEDFLDRFLAVLNLLVLCGADYDGEYSLEEFGAVLVGQLVDEPEERVSFLKLSVSRGYGKVVEDFVDCDGIDEDLAFELHSIAVENGHARIVSVLRGFGGDCADGESTEGDGTEGFGTDRERHDGMEEEV
ncbi:hypothetical protein HK097_004594 [Rhizophlyctis rosea]|uniref:Uncharacterized protein n=1 Tax=Rhizophlyctis rosea TaxID=64517 RepID=A0AAD5X8Z6_9FUNG|nr:hypothetical protein HK097_004594 [Rhizophlyctis rosea]